MFHRRETGSLVLPVPRDQVYELLRRDVVAGQPFTGTPNERLEYDAGDMLSTFVLRDVPGGTRIIHARARRPGLRSLFTPPDGLREEVEADLFRIQRLVRSIE